MQHTSDAISKTVYLRDYQSPVFSIERVELDFELFDDKAIVTNKMWLRRNHPGELRLNGDDLKLLSLEMDETRLTENEYYFDDQDLIIPKVADEFNLKIVTEIKPQENTQLSGLYRSNGLFCTQCEAEGFRRITYYIDRPDVLSVFTTRICADKDKYPVLLSNGNLLDHGILDKHSDDFLGASPRRDTQRHWTVWQDPFKKPSYLFALVAGKLVCVEDSFTTCTGRTIALKIYVEPGNENKCGYAMKALKNAMRWDEEMYGREYDLAIFMIVAVSDFNMGAMENKGLNIFNAKYILACPETATDQDFAGIESVVAHEYFHNWTGNRITCRDWFQLSLKESLTVFRDQEFSRAMNSRDVNRIEDVKLLQNVQFPEDAGPTAHPVRPTSYQEINNFYTATVYDKGAEIIRMQHTLLGQEGFRRGMDYYFENYDGQAVTINDFVGSMEEANGVNFSQFKRWYDQAGTPEVDVHISFEKGNLTLHMKQYCRPTAECQKKESFYIPIRMALFSQEGKQLPVKDELIILKEAEQTLTLTGFSERPVVSLLRDFSAPIKLKTNLTESDFLTLLRYETNGFSKWNAAQYLAKQCQQHFLKKPPTEWVIPKTLLTAYQHVLDDKNSDQTLQAALLTPPSFEESIADLKDIDVALIEGIRLSFRQQLGKTLLSDLETHYQTLWKQEDNVINHFGFGRRKLRNLCLFLMKNANEQLTLHYCLEQFKTSNNMTDYLASFNLLCNATDPSIRQQAIEQFYQKWASDDLVLDKWFSIQASCEYPDTLQRVRNLMRHPAFSMKNPNKVRALIGAFCQSNPRNFHVISGEGYAFLGEILLQLDTINSQIGARLATPLTRWQRYDAPRQALMKAQIDHLLSKKLSVDLREILEKSLQEG